MKSYLLSSSLNLRSAVRMVATLAGVTENGSGSPFSSAVIAHGLALDWESASSSSTSLPSRFASVARAMAVVALPTPPLRLMVEMIVRPSF